MWLSRIYLLFFPLLLASGVNSRASLHEYQLANEFQTFLKTGQFGRILKNISNVLNTKDLLHKSPNTLKREERKVNLFCSTCATLINQILKVDDPDLLETRLIKLCVELNITTELVCEQFVRVQKREIIYILKNTPGENGNDLCGTIFVSFGCTSRNRKRVWEVALPDTPKPPSYEDLYPTAGVPTLKVFHLADTHYDPRYTPGSSVNCRENFLCCQDTSSPVDDNQKAGFWGSYGSCDIPRWTLETTLQQVATNHPDIDFIIWTGDVTPHAVWEDKKQQNLEIIEDMANLITQYFPGIPVYPALGNHESAPANQFPQPYINDPDYDIHWLYKSLKETWSRWLPEEATENVEYSGSYSVKIKPGLRLISINTNYCYGFNLWLVHDSGDIGQELYLMAQELQKAEDAGESVYIIGHIPPGSGECELTWSHQFNKIVSRYENTISGLFYSHTHKDEFEIIFDQDDLQKPVEVIYMAPSQTTYSDLNPGYRIYSIEGEYENSSYRVLNHESWIMDLDAANALNQSTFVKLYSAKEEYALENLSATSWFDLVKEMNLPNSTLFDKFYRNYVKAGNPLMQKGCTDDCKSQLLCDLLISDNSDHSKCKDIIHGH